MPPSLKLRHETSLMQQFHATNSESRCITFPLAIVHVNGAINLVLHRNVAYQYIA